MLRKAIPEDIVKYGDFVYELALDQTRSAYPTYADGIKTKEDFLADAGRAVAEDTSELLLFYREDAPEGWLTFFRIPEERYLQCTGCNIREGTKQALSELLELLRIHFPEYTLYFGFPERNEEAVCFLEKNGFQCIEKAWNNSFFLEEYECPSLGGKAGCENSDDGNLKDGKFKEKNIVRIGRDNYDEFRAVYQPDEEAYWNCDRILECLEEWVIYGCRAEGGLAGAVYFRGSKEYYEIYGMEFAEGKYREEVCRSLLTAALNHCKRAGAKYLTYFCDSCGEALQKAVLEAGFHCVGGYVCYIRKPETV